MFDFIFLADLTGREILTHRSGSKLSMYQVATWLTLTVTLFAISFLNAFLSTYAMELD